MAEFNVTTTGSVASIVIDDVSGKEMKLTHPVVNLDLLNFYTQNEIDGSSDIQNAISAKQILATNEFGIDISAIPASGAKVVKKTIGIPGATGKDFTFTSAGNGTAQNLDLGAIVPAYARVIDVKAICITTLAGATTPTMTFALGNASAGTQFATAGNCYTAGDVVAPATGAMPTTAISSSASKVWVSGDVGTDNWSDLTAGAWEVHVTYLPKAD